MQNGSCEKHFNIKHAQTWLKSENIRERLLGAKLMDRLTDGSVFLLAEVPPDSALVALENNLPFLLEQIYLISQKLYFSNSQVFQADLEEHILIFLMRSLGNCLVLDYLQCEANLRNWEDNCLRVLRGTRSQELKAVCLRALANYSTRSSEQRQSIVAKLKFELKNPEMLRLNSLGKAFLRALVFKV